MDEISKTKSKSLQTILTGILWLVTTILAGISFLSGRRVVLSIHSRFFPGGLRATGPDSFSLINILVSIILACLVIAIVIGGFEYHFRKAGTEESKRMFARTLALECGILLLASFL